ncbi:MAG: amino acid permease [Bacteroidetes bacterium]|nr:amino acid permease [Bacteroidota bacterium]
MQDQPELKRSLGLVDATMIVAGSMIGSGIFLVSADMARTVGSAGYLLLLWIITGVITVMAALSYGELAGMMPNAGGQFVYIERAFGKLTSFIYGWTVFTVIQTGLIAAVGVAFANYTSIFFPELNKEIFSISLSPLSFGGGGPAPIGASGGEVAVNLKQILAIISILFLTFSNSRGIQYGKIIQFVFTSAKLFGLFALIVLGIAIGLKGNTLIENFHSAWDASTTTVNPDGSLNITHLAGFALVGAMGSTIINSLFSADAWNNVTFIAGEIKDPKKNIPRSLFLGTMIVTILYALANVAYLCLLPVKGDPHAADVYGMGIQFATDNRIGAAAATMIFGNVALFIMAGLIMVSTFGCNNGLILAGARVYYAMAKDKLFFEKAGTLNKNSVPATALWLQGAWASALCLSGTYKDLVAYSTFASILFYIVTITGIFVLRKKDPYAERPYKAFGYPVIPALYILAALAICIILIIYDGRNTGFGLACVALGIPVYFLTVGKNKIHLQ